ncbi:MAG: beta-ketoacyl synthase chain length factor [Flavobacteriales bacterium]|nr:beta-ketoacyl synthase chain length factor [Flavobacteriales bacterium]
MSIVRSTSRLGPIEGDPAPIPASAARRLSSIQHEACLLSLAALHRAGVARPDAIVASTALGCLDDTERFLTDLHDAGDALLSPLPFMRSTHNTMAGQLALMLKCDGPNITHAQGFDGFHASLVEAEMLLDERPEWNVLVLAIDERTALLDRLAQALQPGSIVGGGGEAFLLTGASDQGLARITWAEGRTATPLLPDPALPFHGSMLAQRMGDAITSGLRSTLRIGPNGSGATDLLLSPW